MRTWFAYIFVVLGLGCGPGGSLDLSLSGPDSGDSSLGHPRSDMTGSVDMAEPNEDLGMPLSDASTDSGLEMTGADVDLQDPATRTRQQLCDRWNADYPLRASQRWAVEPTSQCAPGVVHADALDDAIRRTTLFRWLVGLEPVTFWEDARGQTQHCATTLDALGRITHDIPTDAPCYTAEAQLGAGSSNISNGANGSVAVTVNQYIRDRGQANARTLGHRRWIFNPKMGQTAFGWNGSTSCMAAFDQSNSGASTEFIAWPPPGPVPTPVVQGNWSIGGNGIGLSSSTTVTVTDLNSNEIVSSDDAYVAEGNYGFTTTVGWTPPPDLAAGDLFEVVVDGLGDGNSPINYVVELVDCSI